jgi:hypothetical protein
LHKKAENVLLFLSFRKYKRLIYCNLHEGLMKKHTLFIPAPDFRKSLKKP